MCAIDRTCRATEGDVTATSIRSDKYICANCNGPSHRNIAICGRKIAIECSATCSGISLGAAGSNIIRNNGITRRY